MDSYLITLLVENGVLGCLLFFITIAIAIWIRTPCVPER